MILGAMVHNFPFFAKELLSVYASPNVGQGSPT